MIPNDLVNGSVECPIWGITFDGRLLLLQRLEYPDALEWVDLRLSWCEGEVDSEFLDPYLRDRIRRGNR